MIFPMIDWFTIVSPCRHQWCFLLFLWFFPMLGDQWFTNPHHVPVMAIPWCPTSLHGSHTGRCSQPLGRDVQLRRGVEASMFGGRSRWALGLDIANHQTKITKQHRTTKHSYLRRTKTKGSALFGPHVGKPRWGAASLVGTWQNRSYGLVWQDVSGWGRKDIYLVS